MGSRLYGKFKLLMFYVAVNDLSKQFISLTDKVWNERDTSVTLKLLKPLPITFHDARFSTPTH